MSVFNLKRQAATTAATATPAAHDELPALTGPLASHAGYNAALARLDDLQRVAAEARAEVEQAQRAARSTADRALLLGLGNVDHDPTVIAKRAAMHEAQERVEQFDLAVTEQLATIQRMRGDALASLGEQSRAAYAQATRETAQALTALVTSMQRQAAIMGELQAAITAATPSGDVPTNAVAYIQPCVFQPHPLDPRRPIDLRDLTRAVETFQRIARERGYLPSDGKEG